MVPHGHPLAPFWYTGVPLGTPWTSLGSNFWPHGAQPWHPMDIPWQQLWPSSVNVLKMTKKIIISSSIFGVFLGRVYMQSDHAGAVQTHMLHILLLSISRRPKKQKVEIRCGPGGGHLGHILDKGGTGNIWRHLGNIWKHLGTSGGIWEASGSIRKHLGSIWRHLGSIWKHLGGIWKQLGSIRRHLGSSWKHLEGIWSIWKHLEASGGHLGASGSIWEASGTIWGASGSILEASWRHLEASGGHLGGIWGSSGRPLGTWAPQGLTRMI